MWQSCNHQLSVRVGLYQFIRLALDRQAAWHLGNRNDHPCLKRQAKISEADWLLTKHDKQSALGSLVTTRGRRRDWYIHT